MNKPLGIFDGANPLDPPKAIVITGRMGSMCDKVCYLCGVGFTDPLRTNAFCSTECRESYYQLRENASLTAGIQLRGINSWGIARKVDRYGYVQVLFRSLSDKDKAFVGENPARGRVAEHRLVVARRLGRALRPDEAVHHKNGNRADNRPENLEAMTARQHGLTHSEALAQLGEARIEIERLESLVRAGIAQPVC